MSVYFVVVPGVNHGDTVLTAVFLVDVGAVLLAVTAGVAGADLRAARDRLGDRRRVRRRGHRRRAGVRRGGRADRGAGHPHGAACGPIAAAIIAIASDKETGGARGRREAAPEPERFLTARVLLPFAAVLAVPATALGIWLAGSLTPWDVAYFSIFFAVVLLLVFGRQAYLLVDNRRAIVRERALQPRDGPPQPGPRGAHRPGHHDDPDARGGADRRAGARDAAPRRARHQLRAAPGRAGELTAVAGAWQDEHAWASGMEPPDGGAFVKTRGGRHVFVFPLLRARQPASAPSP